MVGLGEGLDEVRETVLAIREAGVGILTVGQYLQPSRFNAAVVRYYSPEEFAELRAFALSVGFRVVESAPLVRSSYHAEGHAAR
jgi:lipoic acid synthetase